MITYKLSKHFDMEHIYYHLKVFKDDIVIVSEGSYSFAYLSSIMWDHFKINIDDIDKESIPYWGE